MHKQTKVTGVILAGGRASRMQHQDKGLLHYHGRPLISYAIAELSQVVGQIIINANRNLDQYRQFGYEVVPDQTGNFDGPLAGLLAGMAHANPGLVLAMPCDSPLFKADCLAQLLAACLNGNAQAAVAYNGEEMQPVFLAVKTTLTASLESYLAGGGRKMSTWLNQHQALKVDFSHDQKIFMNINSPEQLISPHSITKP